MSINLLVTGTGSFHYSKEKISSSDPWDLGKLEQLLLAQVAGGGVDSPSQASTFQAVAALSRVMQAQLMGTVIDFLLMRNNAGSIMLYANHKHRLWVDENDLSTIPVSGSDEHNDAIKRQILRFLSRNKMNSWACFIRLLDAFTQFEAQLENEAGNTYRLFVSLED